MLKKVIYALCILAFTTCVWGKPHYATIVMEYPSGNILYSENATTQNQPASLTKVMTLYLVFKALDSGTLKLDQQLHVSAHAANRQPSKLGLRANNTISVADAINGLVTKSANDAASVIAENLAPSEEEFAELMTIEAHRLGLQDTTFMNASGISNNLQLTTAKDMATLGAAILRDFPHYYHYFSLRQFTYQHHVFKNHNHLLGKYMGCDGIKTGFTTASGFNLLSSATRDGHRLIAVVLGGNSIKSRDLRMVQLFDMGFDKLAALQPTQLTHGTPATHLNSSDAESELQPDIESPNTSIEEEY